jgi:hypothetical protein
MVGLGIVVVACLVAALVLSMPLAGLFFGTGIAALVMLAMTAGYFWPTGGVSVERGRPADPPFGVRRPGRRVRAFLGHAAADVWARGGDGRVDGPDYSVRITR